VVESLCKIATKHINCTNTSI